MTKRGAFAKSWTNLSFIMQQQREKARVARELEARAKEPFTVEAPTISLSPAETEWRRTGLMVRAGERVALSARGAIWLSKAMGLAFEPRTTLWYRIAGSPRIEKVLDNDHVFAAWGDGEVELFLKAFSEWASPKGDLLSTDRGTIEGRIDVRIAKTDRPLAPPVPPPQWHYLWRLGDGHIYTATSDDEIAIATHGDVGILQTEVDHPITPNTRLEWAWRADVLPSRLPEDLQLTHDYLSVAVEFEDGKDLTFMWSAGLPHGHVFPCPLPFWCDRETHWVLRTKKDGLGIWHKESRALWDDTKAVYGKVPARAVRLWLIANSVFQRNEGRASVRGLRLREGE